MSDLSLKAVLTVIFVVTNGLPSRSPPGQNPREIKLKFLKSFSKIFDFTYLKISAIEL